MTNLPFIEKTITDSSLISHVKWEQTSTTEDPPQGNLTITFKASPTPYIYVNVPYDVVLALTSATSIGQYFSKNIKLGYTYTK
jgi:hypothetical protein